MANKLTSRFISNLYFMTLKQRIIERLRSMSRWCAKYEVEGWAKLWGYSASSGARRANELAKDHKILQKEENKRTTHNGKTYKVKIAYFKTRYV